MPKKRDNDAQDSNKFTPQKKPKHQQCGEKRLQSIFDAMTEELLTALEQDYITDKR